jgi:hypothetical protein
VTVVAVVVHPGNRTHDEHADQAAFWIAGVLCMLAGVSFLTIGRRTFRPVPVPALTFA